MRVGIAALSATISMTALMTAAGAQQAAQRTPTQLDEINVSAERAPSPVYNSPGTVTVTTSQDIDRQNIRTPRDLVRNEPGVSIANQPGRAGSSNFTIRGIGENRVRLQIDGVKVPDFPGSNIGAGTYTRDFVDLDSLKRVEIIRGPASALYGSDSLGGVVSFITKDPADYLNVFGKDAYFGVKAGVDTADRSFSTTSTGAFRFGPWEAMILYTRRDGKETDIKSDRSPNPQTYFSNNVLAKLVYNTPDAGSWKLTAEGFWKGVATNLQSELATTTAGPTTTRVFSSQGKDNTQRLRLGLDWTKQIDQWFADEIKTTIYWTGVDRQEITRQLRGVGTGPQTTANRFRFSDFDFKQNIVGGDVQLSAVRQIGEWEHRFTYGLTADYTTTSRPRDRFETNLTTGVTTNVISAETFPNKNFPDTNTTQAAVYVQDVAQWGRLRVVPALRVDYYHLDPRPDQAFVNGNTKNFTISEQTKYAVSPKLGFTFDLTDEFRIFGQYAHGFRAPPYDNANFAFSNPVQFYEILPNGNLKPETSNGFEAGLRGRFADGSSFQLAAFYNLYKDFIDTKVVSVTPTGFTTFQYQNLSRVKIWGLEAKGEWKFAPQWTLYGAAAYARGEDEATGAPINSVDPLTGVAGLRYSHFSGWSIEGRVKAVASKNRVSDATVFKPRGYATYDVLASYEINKHISINAGVFNIFDRSYFNAVDVAGVTKTNPNLELFRATGRSFAMNVTARF